MASKALSGEVCRSVMAVRRKGTTTTEARAQLVGHARLGHGARHLDAGGAGPGAQPARARAPGPPLPAGHPPRTTSRASRNAGHRLDEHVDALPGIELAGVQDARLALGQAGKGPPLRHVAAVRDHARPLPRPVRLREAVADPRRGGDEAGGAPPHASLAAGEPRRLARVRPLGGAVERAALGVQDATPPRAPRRPPAAPLRAAPGGGRRAGGRGCRRAHRGAGWRGRLPPPWRGRARAAGRRSRGGGARAPAGRAAPGGRDAVEGEDLLGASRVASAGRTASLGVRPRQGGRHLHDLHAVGALQREADVGGITRHLLAAVRLLQHALDVADHHVLRARAGTRRRRRRGPGRKRRKNPVTWRSSRTRANPEPAIQSAEPAHGDLLRRGRPASPGPPPRGR